MTKAEIIDALVLQHGKFATYMAALDDHSFVAAKNGKWTAGQQAEHIYRSVRPLRFVLGFPKWVIKLYFKKANRPSKTYEQLVQKYQRKLQEGGRAAGVYVPGPTSARQKQAMCRYINDAVGRLCASLHKYSEAEMDGLVLPHPLLGKITLREMMYFTIYHVQHHHAAAKTNLGRR